LAVLVIPFAILAFWGYNYVLNALRLLEAPGVPVQLTYKARGGNVRVTAESYAVDFRRGTARFERLQLSDPKGGVLARLSRVEASGIKPLQLMDQIVHVRASGFAGRLTRLPSGGFDLEQVLPERKGPPTKIPFDFVLDDARVEMVDLMGRTPWRQNVSAAQVQVTGLGDDWLATTIVHAPGIGDFPVQVQNVSNFGLQAATRTRGAEIAPLVAHFLDTPPLRRPELNGLSVRSIRLVGPVRLFLPQSKTPRIETRLVAYLRDARYREYRADNAKFSGLASLEGASGVLQAESDGNRVRFDGSVLWKNGIRAGGKANVVTPGLEALPTWVRRQIPAGTSFRDARFDGWVSYASKDDFRLSGVAKASEARYQGETAYGLDAHVQVFPKTLVANVRRVTYGGEPASGAFALDIRSKTLRGTVAAGKVDFGLLAKRFGLKGLEGEGSVLASVGGTLSNPAVDLDVTGQARYTAQSRTLGGRFDLSARYGGNAVDIRRALLTGDFGLVSASGSIGREGSLGIQVVARGLNPKTIDPNFKGRANLVAKVSGTAKNPRAQGYLEAYNFSAKNYLVPSLATDFVVDRRHAELNGLRAVRGPSEVAGNASYRFSDKGISSRLKIQGLQIADLLGEEFAGAIDVPDARVAGTLDRPRVTASVVGRNVVARGIKVDAVTGRLESDGRMARLDDASAQVAGGIVKGTARYNLQRSAGTADFSASGLALQTITPKLSTAVAVDGAAGGVVHAAFNPNGLTSLTASGKLDEVAINETKIGSGRWEAAYNGKSYTGYLGIGSPTSYVELDDLGYDPKTGAATGTAYLLNSRLEDLVAITRRYFPNLSYDVLEALRTTSGLVNLGATFAGTPDAPTLNVDKLTATDLKYRDVNLGTLSTSFAFANDRWDVRSLSLTGQTINASASGFIDQNGNTDVSGDIPDVALAEIGRIFPVFAGQTGTASVTFNASGPTKSPDIRLSLLADELFRAPNEKPGEGGGLHALVNGRVNGAENRATIDGAYSYRGFAGNIEASSPFEFPWRIPENGQANGRITLTPRDLKQIAPELTAIDPTRTTGTIGGEIRASGTPNNLTVTGDISLLADSLGFVVPPKKPGDSPLKINDSLKNVTAKVSFENNRLAVKSDFDSSRGGHLHADVSTPVNELRRFAQTVQEQGLQALLDNPLTGDVTLNALAARQDFPGKTYVGGVADGKIDVGGSLRRPRFTGAIALSHVDSVIPTFEPGDATVGETPIDPSFDLRLSLTQPAKLRTTAAELYVLGGGRVTGSLASPQVQSTLELEKGTIRLPAAVVRLEQGGTVSLNYQPAPGGAFTSIDVDLEGRTALTALRYGDVYERYDITLGVRGDLLREGGLTLTAQSDPADLSQERILALLGHTELLTSLSQGIGQSATERRFRDALAGYALPALTDPITSRLAQGLGLDYLTLEYNPFEQTSVVFAKSLGGGFIVQGRRQIGEPPPGFRPLYDLRLVYRPRRVRGVLSRFSFSIGADQDRPFKAALEYGTRF
jgi:hypothetical protein